VPLIAPQAVKSISDCSNTFTARIADFAPYLLGKRNIQPRGARRRTLNLAARRLRKGAARGSESVV
jgi:hypothetical protein